MEDNYIRMVDVVKVVDGDTFYGIVHLLYGQTAGTKDVPIRFRLLGVNTPERGQDGYQTAKDFLTTILYGKTVAFKAIPYKGDIKRDAFDRFLGTVYVDDVNVNEKLLTLGLAVPYKR